MKSTIVVFALLITFTLLSSCKKDPIQATNEITVATESARGNSEQVNIFKGPEVHMGYGKARSWISVNHAGVPQELGVEMTAASMYGLPQDPGNFAAATFNLPLHQKAKALTPFDHIAINWNVHGHEPMNVFDVPHFDFHFYMISLQEQMAIPPYPMAPAAFDLLPPQNSWPDFYFATPGGVPQMGKHWIDAFFAPPFNKTMVYGSYNGKFIFVEPMITRSYLLQGDSYTEAYRQPHVYVPSDTWYPELYNIYRDAASGTHYVTLSGFSLR